MKFLFDHDVPDDLAYTLTAMGHQVSRLRELLDVRATDEELLKLAGTRDLILITCNRDEFITLAQDIPHVGIIILVRRNSRMLERVALFRLLEKAGDEGIRNNINFA